MNSYTDLVDDIARRHGLPYVSVVWFSAAVECELATGGVAPWFLDTSMRELNATILSLPTEAYLVLLDEVRTAIDTFQEVRRHIRGARLKKFMGGGYPKVLI